MFIVYNGQYQTYFEQYDLMIKFIVEANNIEINYNFMYNLPYIWT